VFCKAQDVLQRLTPSDFQLQLPLEAAAANRYSSYSFGDDDEMMIEMLVCQLPEQRAALPLSAHHHHSGTKEQNVWPMCVAVSCLFKNYLLLRFIPSQ
jgi:hypothetical protein